MLKIKIAGNDIIITIATATGGQKQIEIVKGQYEKRYYSNIVFLNNAIILEGDEEKVLATNVITASVKVKSVKQQIAEILGNEEIYLLGIDAIPDRQERAILERMI